MIEIAIAHASGVGAIELFDEGGKRGGVYSRAFESGVYGVW